MKQTAVQWLEAHLIEYGFDLSLHKIEIEQAKEMEKNQILDAFEEGSFDIMHSQEYYDKTYTQSSE